MLLKAASVVWSSGQPLVPGQDNGTSSPRALTHIIHADIKLFFDESAVRLAKKTVQLMCNYVEGLVGSRRGCPRSEFIFTGGFFFSF